MDLYSKINANKNIKEVNQPNLTRQRHRYKGTRESEKFNLEIDQVRYDLLNYAKQVADIKSTIKELYELFIINGVNIEEIFGDQWPEGLEIIEDESITLISDKFSAFYNYVFALQSIIKERA